MPRLPAIPYDLEAEIRRLTRQGQARYREYLAYMRGRGLSYARPALWLAMGSGGGDNPTFSTYAAPAAWYEPSQTAAVFKDVAGTTPPTAFGDEVLLARNLASPGTGDVTGTAGSGLLYLPGICNGRAGLYGDGVGRFLQAASTAFLDNLQAATVVLVASVMGPGASGAVAGKFSGGGNGWAVGESGQEFPGDWHTASGEPYWDFGRVLGGAHVATLTYRTQNGQQSARLNGMAFGTAQAATLGSLSNALPFRLMQGYTNGWCRGCLLALVIYPAYLSDSTTALIESAVAMFRYPLSAGPLYATPAGAPLVNGNHGYNFLPSVVPLANGTTALFWQTTDGDGFTNGSSQIRLTVSEDEGKTWGTPSTIIPGVNGFDIDSGNGAAQIPLSSPTYPGRILLPWTQDDGNSNRTNLYVDHTDDPTGLTGWTYKAVSVPLPGGYTSGTGVFVPYGRIQLQGNRLFLGAYALNTASGKWDSLLLQSADYGVTWTLHSVVLAGATPVANADETDFAFLPGGKILAFVRAETSPTSLYMVQYTGGDSNYQGGTWGAAAQTVTGGVVSPMCWLDTNGDVLLFYAFRGGQGSGVRGVRVKTPGGTPSLGHDHSLTMTSNAVCGYPSFGGGVLAWYDQANGINFATDYRSGGDAQLMAGSFNPQVIL